LLFCARLSDSKPLQHTKARRYEMVSSSIYLHNILSVHRKRLRQKGGLPHLETGHRVSPLSRLLAEIPARMKLARTPSTTTDVKT
jgi:hypothetical protein